MIICRICGVELELRTLPLVATPYLGKDQGDLIWMESDNGEFWLSCGRTDKLLHEPRVMGLAGDLLDLFVLERELR